MEIQIGDYKVSDVQLDAITDTFVNFISANKPGVLIYANAQTYNLALKNRWLLDLNKDSKLVLADGYGMVWAAKVLGIKPPRLVTLTYQDKAIATACTIEKKRLFLLGGVEGVANEAANTLLKHEPNLEISGTHHGYFSKSGAESDAIIEYIRSSGTNVLIVGFGSPLQEQWYLDNKEELSDIACIMGGNCLTYWAGYDTKPPGFMTRNGLAWLYRCYKHPLRYGPRYLVVIPEFVCRIFWHKIFKRRSKGSKQ